AASNMRGTDNALKASNYTAPDNTAIGAIKAVTDKITFSGSQVVTSVSNLTAAALKLFTTRDIGTTVAQPQTVAKVSQGSAGGGGNNVYPTFSQIPSPEIQSSDIFMFVGETDTRTIIIKDSQDEPVNMTGKQLSFLAHNGRVSA